MQNVDWTDLHVFLTLARTRQLTRAGRMLGVDGTTIGRRLRRLEERLAVTLFEQTREGHVLTEAGERLLIRVEEMDQAACLIGDSRSGTGSTLSGTLRISVSEGFGTWFLARHLATFASRHPALTVDLVASSGFLSLSKREADIAVMLSRPKAGPTLARKLSDYTLRLYASPAYLETMGMPAEASALRTDHRLVAYIPDLIYAPELNYLDELMPGLAPHLRSSSINAQHQLIRAGAGLGVLPCFIGEQDDTLVPVLPQLTIQRSFWLVTHRDTHQLARIRAGKEWLLETVQNNSGLLLRDAR